jgi:hypothetical protein
MTPRRAAALFACSVGLACAAVDPEAKIYFTPLSTPPHALYARLEAQLQIFGTGPPAWPFVDIGVFEYRSLDDSTLEFVNRLRPVAAKEGCDGVVLQPVRHHMVGLGGREAVHRADCIVYLPSSAPPAAPSQP